MSTARPNTKLAVQKASVAEAFLAGYEFLDDEGCPIQSEAVTLTDSCGDEVIGPKTAASSIPVVVASVPAELPLGHETPVSAVAVLVLSANVRRGTAVVQNVGLANIRVGPAGVTPTTGIRVVPDGDVEYIEPNVFQGDLWAIREGAVDSIALAQEELIPDVSGPACE